MSIVVNNQEVITEADENNQLYRKRQSLSQTSRTISLPFQINEKAVKASYKDGLLEIRVPKQAGKKSSLIKSKKKEADSRQPQAVEKLSTVYYFT